MANGQGQKHGLGFTVMELMIVVLIVAILASASIPLVRPLLIQSRLIAAAESFAQQMRLLRSEALERQQMVYVHLQTGSAWCYGGNASSTCLCSPSNTCTLASVNGSSYNGVGISVTGFSGGNVSFDSVRGVLSEASSVTFSEDSYSVKVSLNSSGLIALCSTNVSGYPAC